MISNKIKVKSQKILQVKWVVQTSVAKCSISWSRQFRPTSSFLFLFIMMKRKLKIKPIYQCWCNGRLQAKRFTRLSHTGLVVELEHLKIKTRLTNEKFASVKGECDTQPGVTRP